jgi:large subunit ribosomal protein L14
MKPIKARMTKGLQKGSIVNTCDNSGAKIVRILSFKGSKTVHGRNMSGGVGGLATVSVVKGSADMRKKVVQAVVVRQRKEYRRLDGTRVKFEDNAVVIVKDKKGNPAGTLIKGAVAREACERWGPISKIASVVV